MFIADRYEILLKIGSGGMSDVYKAMDHKLNRFVAIKVLKNEYSEDKNFVGKFRAEAQAAAGLIHANIVSVYDVGEESGMHYIVMELVEGITLKKYIEKKGRLGVREAVSIAIQMAQGIEAAHKHSIVHRDIKPQNIIISKEGKVKVTDFGIARAASTSTINSQVMGSVHYISPEQARGGYCDSKSDIYSFGVSLYEMLTGRVPFEGESTVSVALQHIQDDIISPKKYAPDIPISVEKIVLKCTQKKTDRRYQNMADLIADLKRSLVTPDEDFVVIAAAAVPTTPTQLITDEEMAEITKASSKKNISTEGILTEDTLDDIKVDESTATGYDNPSSDDDYSDVEEDDDDDDDDDNYVDPDAVVKSSSKTKKLDRIITILGILLAVVILVITVVIIFKLSNIFGGNGSSSSSSSKTSSSASSSEQTGVKVPNVLGMTYEEAKKALNDVGLGIKKVEDYSSTYSEGLIFLQSVDAHEYVSNNTTIIVTVSKGSEDFVLGSVEGLDQAEGERQLKAKNLVTSVIYEETDDDTLVGKIKSQAPVAGTTVKSGDTITLTVYRGADTIMGVVPEIVGKTESAARKAIEDAGFVIGEVTYKYDEEVEEGVVISQSGAVAGEQAVADGKTTIINMVVSEGSFEVPDITGMTEGEAAKALEDASLKVGKVTEEYSSEVEAGRIISQGTKAKTKVAKNTEIDYVISLGIELVEVPNIVGNASSDAKAALEALGLTSGTVAEANSDTVAAGVVISQGTEAATKVSRGTAIDYVVSLGPVQDTTTVNTVEATILGADIVTNGLNEYSDEEDDSKYTKYTVIFTAVFADGTEKQIAANDGFTSIVSVKGYSFSLNETVTTETGYAAGECTIKVTAKVVGSNGAETSGITCGSYTGTVQ